MRIVYLFIGVTAVIGGLSLLVKTALSKTEIALGLCFGIALVIAGIIHLVAAVRSYRGHWSFVIGVALILLGFLGIGSEIDDSLKVRSHSLELGINLILMFSITGALSLWSGHKLHRCSLELERKSRSV